MRIREQEGKGKAEWVLNKKITDGEKEGGDKENEGVRRS